MSLVGLQHVSWGFGGEPLLEEINLQIESGERICLVGRNGTGKTSLLKLISRSVLPDSGEIRYRKGITVGVMDQEVPHGLNGSVFEVVSHAPGNRDPGSPPGLHAKTQHPPADRQTAVACDDGHWEQHKAVETILSRTGLDPQQPFATLSAGMKRRVIFARALTCNPDLLLLDEPTNHLDIEAIEWMESFILRYVKTVLFVSHDRNFLQRIATRIVELDRGQLVSYDGGYDTYLARREAVLETEARHQQLLDKKLSREEAWIRQGIKARRTRNQGRVRALEKLRAQVRRRRSEIGQARIRLQEAESTGKIVIEARSLSLSYGGTPIVRDLSTIIMRGDKVGVIGPNGAGKTTLLNLLLENTSPDSGTVRHGTRLQIAYYDQLRTQLDDELTVAQTITAHNDFIVFNNQKRHVISYLQDFLFSPQRCRTPVRILSGGERNRLMLAKLFTIPANVLVLDEPTNDLDTDTLELLEELLLEYEGTVLLVSHDRCFLNNVVTSTLVFEGQGRIVEYAGGYDDWLSQRPQTDVIPDLGVKSSPKARPRPASSKPRKLGYLQTRELTELPGRIEALESEQQAIHAVMADPEFYKQDQQNITNTHNRLSELEAAIAAAYARWEALEAFNR